jgi:hypothetical protein
LLRALGAEKFKRGFPHFARFGHDFPAMEIDQEIRGQQIQAILGTALFLERFLPEAGLN